MKIRRRIGISAAGITAAGAAVVSLALAADNGNWVYNNCAAYPAVGCAYEDLFNHAPSLASSVRDSTFTNDYYGNGHLLNDNVHYFKNTFTSQPLCLYQHSNYVTPKWTVAAMGNTNALPTGTSSGASSFRAC